MEKLTPLNITRIKSITNGATRRAYIDLDSDEFILHWPDSKRGNILSASTDEILVLFQKLDSNRNQLTHLVIPIDQSEAPEGDRENFRFGRRVKVLAATGTENAIELSSTLLSELDLRNRGWGTAEPLNRIAQDSEVSRIQIDLWNRFRPFFTTELNRLDSEFSYLMNQSEEHDLNITGEEGRLKLVTHKIRERDKKLVRERKQHALAKGELICEVCKFSFIDTYKEDYIECHHDIPINEGVRITNASELRLVCSNCHRMLHRKINGEYLTIESLAKLIERQNN